MSAPRFAPITSALFARKGDAVPSAATGKPALFWTRDVPPPPPPPLPPVESAAPQTDRATPPPLAPGEKPHRMVLTLNPVEFEKLGIAAVKKGVTRHQVLRTALDAHLDRLKREYGGCGCMAMGGGCTEGCGAA